MTKTVQNNDQQIAKLYQNKYFIYPTISLIIAAILVYLWFPANLWQYPIQFTDAPAHYYYIAKLVNQGFGTAFHLTSENQFYPPLWHIVAALMVKFFSVNIMTGAALSWLFFNCLVFPLGNILLVWYFIDKKNLGLLTLTPIISIVLTPMPYLLLHQGPLLAYGSACTLLPLTLFFTLKTFDIFLNWQAIVFAKYFSLTICLLILDILAQPRIIFTYLLILLPFIINYLIQFHKINPKLFKRILQIIIILIAIFISLTIFYVLTKLKSSLLLHPENWFTSHTGSNNYLYTFLNAFSGGILLFKTSLINIILASFLSIIAIYIIIKNFLAKNWQLASAYILIAIIFILADTSSGAIGNLLTAPWYHDENRIATALPTILICLIYQYLVSINYKFEKTFSNTANNIFKKSVLWLKLNNYLKIKQYKLTAILSVMSIFIIFGLIYTLDTTRNYLGNNLNETSNVNIVAKNSILTIEKINAFNQMNSVIGINDLVYGDPFTGLQYYYIYQTRPVFFPYINPRIDKNPEMKNVLLSFGTPDPYLIPYTSKQNRINFVNSKKMLNVLCKPTGNKKFFVDFGKPYRTDMIIYNQFSGFRNQQTIAKYVKDKAFKRVLQIPSGQSNNFIVYQLACN
ncbi:MAG: hypothetical protein LBT99_02245 [Bifidobacteriaceae bacterium]|jgi:hypothetical protein|nr:hypothetical protein [Bifidobacteriaceae bacterium]